MTLAYPARGAFWPQDQWGRVLNAATQRSELNLTWSVMAEDAVDLSMERFGKDLHSVYLSGPAARNRPGGGSLIILLNVDAPAPSTDNWSTVAAAELLRRYDIKYGLNIHVLRWRDVFCPMGRFSPAKFRLAVNSICVGGRNLSRLITPQRIDKAAANTPIVTLESRLNTAKQKTLTSDSRHRIRNLSAEVGHAIVSAGYASVMVDEEVYTEDLDIRRDVFAMHYGDLSEQIHRAYDMAALPGCDPVQVRAFINTARDWIMPIANKWLNEYNPNRLELLDH